MERDHESKFSDTTISRRRVLAFFAGAGITAIGSWLGRGRHQDISDSEEDEKLMHNGASDSIAQSTKEPRLAYVALPGLSTASLLANLPYLMNGSSRLQPIILMDIHDYNRLQAIALEESGSPWNQSLAMAYGHLLRRGVVQLIDYAEFYSGYAQRKILTQNREMLENVATDTQRQAAIDAANGRISYQRGEYQESFRATLGEDLDVFDDGRRTEKARCRKLQRGCIDPLEWNEHIINQYTAALEVRGVADEVFDHLDVKYIIGEGEAAIVGDDGLTTEASHIQDQRRIETLPPTELEYTRDIFETLGELAVEMTGVQHDDWVLISPTLAIPQYDDLFDMSQIRNRVEGGVDPKSLSKEVEDTVEILSHRTEDTPDPTSTVEWLMESDIIPFADKDPYRQRLTEMSNYAATLSQISDTLRPLVRSGEVSHVAGLISVSIVSDPPPHDDLVPIYQRGEGLINRLDPPSVDAEEITAIRRRKQEWNEASDWYETADRVR